MSSELLIEAAASLRDDVDEIASEITSDGLAETIYNPLMYAWKIHEAYLRIAGDLGAKAILLGMNPGPHGMGQMGIPFATTSVVRNLFGITDIEVMQPHDVHPRRPINGLSHLREEVSGSRLWGALYSKYGSTDEIFSNVFVVNHCPLMIFSGDRATNITPDKISGTSVRKLLERCDEHLSQVVRIMGAKSVIGVGKYAERRAAGSFANSDVSITSCWHPSPASPLANRNGGEDWRMNFASVLP